MEILFIVDKNNFFGQTRKPWVSINTEKFISELKNYGISCELSQFPKISTNTCFPKDKTIFYHENNFRASGAKKFDINFDPDEKLLDAASSFKEAFPETPYLSMDIIFDERDATYKLLEFQAMHFGLNVLVKNDGYFTKKSSSWEKEFAKHTIEEEFAYGLAKFLGQA